MTSLKPEKSARPSIWKEESGNVLFLILIAVALFAALSYAVTQSTRSGGGDAGRETSKISSAQLTQYPAGIRTSLVRMIIGGQNVDTLEFNSAGEFAGCTEYPTGSLEYPRCVFHPTGGGATYVNPSNDLVAAPTTWVFNGDNEIELVGTTTAGAGVATGTVDLIAFLPDITLSVCQSINEELGITGIPTETDVLFTNASNMINPNGATDTSLAAGGGSIGVDAAELDGQPFGCFQQPAGRYVYYHVLIER
ncbi:MAG: hypothetical protein H6867_11385 [Rhodospirillales bacterium]|nr:hypothetical protein [Rhodospirillales bacterium]MCB9996732.1 hypothetical protein [Rhodospirillales bacterium]